MRLSMLLLFFAFAFAARRRSGAGLPLMTRIVPILQYQGALTLPALLQALEMQGSSAQANVMRALDRLIAKNQVMIVDETAGTPQVPKLERLKYKLVTTAF